MKLRPELVGKLTTAGKLYEVGGAVRDSLIPGQTRAKDVDFLVTGIPYRELCAILEDYGRVDLVGRSFGVIKFTQRPNGSLPTAVFDFVLPRKEFSTGVGHRDFEVSFDHRLKVEDDLLRRDFTINAIARDLMTGQYVDPLRGREDINSRLIRYTSPNSFAEDPLRMLRAVQFAARFEFTIEPETWKGIGRHADLISTVSAERIAEELSKLLLKADKPSIGFLMMQQCGLLKYTIPELEEGIGVDQPGPYHQYPVFEHSLYTVDAAPKNLIVRMSALLHDIAKPQSKRVTEDSASFYGHETIGARTSREILERLRYSNDFIDQVVTLVDKHMFATDVTDKGMRRLIRRVGQELIFDLLDLRRADVVGQGMGGKTEDVDVFEKRIREEIRRKPPFGLADLAVNGNDLKQEFSLPEGKIIGEILDNLLELVLDLPEKNDYNTLMAEAKAYLNMKVKEN